MFQLKSEIGNKFISTKKLELEDPYSRRPTRPKMACGIKKSDNSASKQQLHQETITMTSELLEKEPDETSFLQKSMKSDYRTRDSDILIVEKVKKKRISVVKPTNTMDRVKGGNKKVDGATMLKLKAENEKFKVLSIVSSCNKISSSEQVEDSFTSRETKPKMGCGVKTIKLSKLTQENAKQALRPLVSSTTSSKKLEVKRSRSSSSDSSSSESSSDSSSDSDSSSSSYSSSSSSSSEEVEDSFAHKPTKPIMTCEVKPVQNLETSKLKHQQTVQLKPLQVTAKQAPKPLEKKPVEVRKIITLPPKQPTTTTSQYDPLKECFNPIVRSKASNSMERVKEGNKRINGETIKRLKAENRQKSDIVSSTTKKLKMDKTSSGEEVEVDPFARRPTRPKISCGVKTIQTVQEPQHEAQKKPLEETTENALKALEHELLENIPLPIAKTLEDEIINKKLIKLYENRQFVVKKRAPEPHEEEPEQKKIKLTIIIERAIEDPRNKSFLHKYRIKH